jgi:hypothetical protein
LSQLGEKAADKWLPARLFTPEDVGDITPRQHIYRAAITANPIFSLWADGDLVVPGSADCHKRLFRHGRIKLG